MKRSYKIKYNWQVLNLSSFAVLGSGQERTADKALEAAESIILPAGTQTRIEISPVRVPRKSLRGQYSEMW